MKIIKTLSILIALLIFSIQNSSGQSCSYVDRNGDNILAQQIIGNVISNSPNHTLEYQLLVYKNGMLFSCDDFTSTSYTCHGQVTFHLLTYPECDNLGSYTINTTSTCPSGGGSGGLEVHICRECR